MEMSIIFLGAYGIINLFGAILLSFDITYSIGEMGWRRFLIFPMVWERLRYDLNIIGSIIAISLFTIGLLPAIVAIYVVELFLFLVGAIVCLFQDIFKRRD